MQSANAIHRRCKDSSVLHSRIQAKRTGAKENSTPLKRWAIRALHLFFYIEDLQPKGFTPLYCTARIGVKRSVKQGEVAIGLI